MQLTYARNICKKKTKKKHSQLIHILQNEDSKV